VVDRRTLRAIRSGAVRVVPAVVGLDRTGAQFADGSHVRVDDVIAATGFRPDLDGLVGHLGVLDDDGLPLPPDRLPGGLHFIGFQQVPGQLVLLPGQARRLAARARSADLSARLLALERPGKLTWGP